MRATTADKLTVWTYDTREQMGADAAQLVALRIKDLLSRQPFVNIIFAAAASQNEFLAAIVEDSTIPWHKVNAFHMDEYIGLDKDHEQRFANFLKKRLFDKVPFNKVFYLNETGANTVEEQNRECERYATLLAQHPPHITCMGIGENTHLAFNDPHVAKFSDPYLVKVVDLDLPCKQQQVNEGCFASTSEVPSYAFTLTIPALLQAEYIYCIAPGPTKAEAVYHTLYDDVSERYPSTILRKHDNAILFLDKQSAAKIASTKVEA